MREYVIRVWGDNDRLHDEALAAAVKAVEQVNRLPVSSAVVRRPSVTRAEFVTQLAGEVTPRPGRP